MGKTMAILLLVCFIVSLTATAATAKTYHEGMGIKEDNNPNSVDDHNVIMKYQQTLAALGYLDPDYATGYYGPETTQAVKNFQKDYKVPVTGKIGGLTHKKMYNSPTFKHPIRSVASAWAWYHNDATFYELMKRAKIVKESGPDVSISVSV